MSQKSYFQCAECDTVKAVPTSDLPTTGAPLCPNCKNPDEDGMSGITRRQYDKAWRDQEDLSPIELLHLLAEAVKRAKDRRIADVTAENDNADGELIITLHNKTEIIIRSKSVEVHDAEKIEKETSIGKRRRGMIGGG